MAEKNTTPEFARDIWENLAKWLHKQKKYDPKSLADPEPLAAIRETHRILSQSLQEMKIGQEIPEELTAALNNNIFYFLGFKTHHELVQASRMLKDSDGNFKPFHKFLNDIETLNKTYNKNYLRAEYNFATASTQMAIKWKEWEQDEERYNLQYRTAGDDRVREEHAALNGVTLPPSDPFWNSYLPPNGWNCRCTTVQVRKNKYPQSNSEKAMAAGAACTAKPKQQIFRFNPGKTMTVFPPKHPYYKANGEVKKTVEKITSDETRLEEIIKELPDNLTNEEKKAIAQNCIDIEKTLNITKGKPMSIEEADEQKANPNFVPKFIPDPNGTYRDKCGNRYCINPKYNEKIHEQFSINCQTCTPAYLLRIRGFNLYAKGCTNGSKSEYLSYGNNAWEIWRNADGTPATHVSTNNWMKRKGYKQMTKKRYEEFFNETCKDEGIYGLSIAWKKGSGHMTILQRTKEGVLLHVEPQKDNSSNRSIEHLCVDGLTQRMSNCRGIMRIDNKILNTKYLEIFNVTDQ